MTKYIYSSVDEPQAVGITATDSVVFDVGGGSIAGVHYIPAANGDPAFISVDAGDDTVKFGQALSAISAAGHLTTLDGSMLYVGDAVANDGPITGTALGDGLFGGGGADTLNGMLGADVLQGDQGGDSLTGGLGSDTLYGGADNDYIVVGVSAGVDDSSNWANGNKGDDTLVGGQFGDTLLGGQGNDSINGENGPNDYLNGNAGDDTVAGGVDADTLMGEGGNDSLNGGGGNDTISGGAGVDQLVGGAGSDLFKIAVGDSPLPLGGLTSVLSLDHILDWTSADKLHFDFSGAPNGVLGTAANFHELSGVADLGAILGQVGTLIGSGQDDFVAVQLGADVIVFADSGNDNGGPDTAVVLSGKTLADIDFSNLV